MSGAGSSTFPSAARARWFLLVLALVGFLGAADIAMTAILIEPMKLELSLTDVQIGLLQGTAYGVVYAIVAIPIGRLVDSQARIPIVLTGVAVCALAMAGTAFAHNLATLLACRGALGGVSALLVPASVSLLSDLYPPSGRSIATSLFVAGQAVGGAFGIFAAGRLFDVFSHLPPGLLHGLTAWRALYLLMGASSLLLVPLLLTVREPGRQEMDGDARSFVVTVRELWQHRGFIAPLLGALLFNVLAFVGTSTWPAPLLTRRFGLTPGQFSGWLSAVTLITGIIGALLGGWLAEQGRRRAGAPGVLLPAVVASMFAAPAMAFGIAPTVSLFAAALGVCLFFAAALPIIGVVSISLNLPNDLRGLAIGLYAASSMLFAVAGGPTLIAITSRALGGEAKLGEAILVVSAPSTILAAILFAVAMRGSRDRATAPPAARGPEPDHSGTSGSAARIG